MIRRPPRSPPFPFTPLFRSQQPTPQAPPAGTAQPVPPATAPGAPPRQEADRARPRDDRFAPGVTINIGREPRIDELRGDRKSTRLNSSHANISYAVFCLKKK